MLQQLAKALAFGELVITWCGQEAILLTAGDHTSQALHPMPLQAHLEARVPRAAGPETGHGPAGHLADRLHNLRRRDMVNHVPGTRDDRTTCKVLPRIM